MSMLDNIVEEHIRLLYRNGYDEEALGSPDRVGKLASDLRRHLSRTVSEGLAEGIPIDFTLEATGFFNDNRDCCRFELHYRFDADTATLLLHRLDLVDGTSRLSITLAAGELPHALDAYRIFKTGETWNTPAKTNSRKSHRRMRFLGKKVQSS